MINENLIANLNLTAQLFGIEKGEYYIQTDKKNWSDRCIHRIENQEKSANDVFLKNMKKPEK